MAEIDKLKQSALPRIVACGSAGDGVSTLIDLLLLESKRLYPSLAGAAQHGAADHDARNESEVDLGRPAARQRVRRIACTAAWRHRISSNVPCHAQFILSTAK